MDFEEWWATLETREQHRADKALTEEAFAAGAASRDAERIAELEDTVNHLILESTGWMNAASFHRQKADQLRELLELDAKAAEIAEQVTFAAGAASRDAEIAELVAALEHFYSAWAAGRNSVDVTAIRIAKQHSPKRGSHEQRTD